MGVVAAVYLLAFTWTVTVTTVWGQNLCPQAEPCMNLTESQPSGLDECGYFTKPMPCLAGLKDVCDVNETIVTFHIVEKLAAQGCRAGINEENYQCVGFSPCMSQTEFLQTTTKDTQNLTAISDRLVDAAFWCHYLEQGLACVINHSCSALGSDALRRIQPLHKMMTTACAGEDKVTGACGVGCELSCRASMEECWAGFDSLNASNTCNVNNTAPDTCKALQNVLKCVRAAPLGPCANVSWLKSDVRDLDTKVELSCSVKAACGQQLKKCACATRFDLLGNPCQNYNRSLQCVKTMPANCRAHSDLQALMDNFRGKVFAFNYMQCDPKGGGCPGAIQCVMQWQQRLKDAKDRQVTTRTELRLQQLLLFECLDTVSRTCNVYQGRVTFMLLKAFRNDFFITNEPDPSPASCRAFMTCVSQNWSPMPTLDDSYDGEGQVDLVALRKMAHTIASMTRTGFWCNAQVSEYQCLVDNAEQCSLPAGFIEEVSQYLQKLKDLCVGAAIVGPFPLDGVGPNSEDRERRNRGAAIGWRWVTWSGAALLLTLRPLLSP